MKKVFLGLLFFTAALQAQIITYQPLSITANPTDAPKGVIRNPERGYYYPFATIDGDYVPGSSFQYTKLTQDDIDYAVGLGANLIQRIVRLDDFKTVAIIPEAFLQNLRDDLNLMKLNGIKCVLRFSYSDYEDYTHHTGHVYDATEALITGLNNPISPIGHIGQLAVVTKNTAYEPIISSIEAGFIGNWGEWFYSTNFGNPDLAPITTAQYAARQRVGQRILALGANRLVAYRTPFIQKQMTALGLKTTPVVNAVPGNGDGETAPASRVAAHNDCFLADENDVNTYQVGTNPTPYFDDREYLKTQSINTFDGGEFCGLDENYANLIGTPIGSSGAYIGNAIKQMQDFHFNYLNLADDPDEPNNVIHYWKTHSFPLPSQQGTFYNEVDRRLGYRFELVNSNVNTTTKDLTITLKNVGFAKMFNFRKVYLVLRNTAPNATPAEFRVRLMNVDPRDWLAHPTNTYTITKNLINMVTGPGGASVSNGTYKLYLYMPDNNSTLSDIRYCVRFANANIGTTETFWNTSANLPGYNNLYRTVTINNGAGTVSKIGEEDIKNYFEATAYPNPFATAFNIKVNTIGEENINLSIYDMLGRLIDSKQSNPADINSLEIGAGYPTGVYTIVVTQGVSKQSIRMVKK